MRSSVRRDRAAMAVTLAVILAVLLPTAARAQMPDLSQMSGRSLPSPEMPAGTVSVRVIRGAITNNVPDQDVKLEGEGQPRSGRTDASGRAMFPGLTPGSTWRAVVTVDGERLESQPFVVPSSGGLRVILAAGVGAGAGASGGKAPAAGATPGPGVEASGAAKAPPVAGEVLLGSQSRFVIELAEGALEVYGLLPLGNTRAAPVMPAQPIVFQAPDGAKSLTVLEGSTPQAKVVGDKVVVTGPFAPGETPLQIAYRIPYEGDTVSFTQALPLVMRQTTVVARKLGNLRLEVPGTRSQREARFEGRTYVVVSADRVDANGQLPIRLRGLPHRPDWPRYVALMLALGITLAGVWIALQPDRGAMDDTDARALRVRRATLFEQLVTVERRLSERAANKPAEEQSADRALQDRREALIAEIEDLDDVLDSVTSAARARAARARSGQVAADASKAAAFADGGASSPESRPAVR
jgi:hypothetical protein